MLTSSIGPVDLVTFLVAIVLPLINGFLTKQVWPPVVRGTLLALLAFIASVMNELLNSLIAETPFDVGLALLKFGGIFALAVASYFGVLSRAIGSSVDDAGNKRSVASIVASKGV